ncbi:helix-turn-helix domain-containing protein [Acidobacteria bacterium AB60]|nr:helix-turn-helix domain-containing protein [Acidobacteria bacterium AB60]
MDADALYIRDGKFLTSAGVTAGIDLSLAMIEEDFGPQVALAAAGELVVYMKRPGGQQQFSEPLKFQAASTKGFADLAAWVSVNLDRHLTVEVLADRMNLSPRQFSRGFTAEFNESPAAFVRRLRLEEARSRLSSFDCPVDSVGSSVGFGDADSFRRAFVQRYGVAPRDYRSRFSAKARQTGSI